jgi:hypothetical protein
MANKLNQGSSSRNNKEVRVRTGVGGRVVNERAVSQIGQTLGNHVTESGKMGNPIEKTYGANTQTVKFGNEVALNVGGGGPGAGRRLVGKSGTNCTTGPVAPGVPGLPSTKGQWPS